MKRIGNCYIDGCGNPIAAKGLCSKHYRRFRAHGSPDIVCKKGPKKRWSWKQLNNGNSRICPVCGKPFYVGQVVFSDKKKYCSRACQNIDKKRTKLIATQEKRQRKQQFAEHRRAGIKDMRSAGMTLASIGAIKGISRQRVEQILKGCA